MSMIIEYSVKVHILSAEGLEDGKNEVTCFCEVKANGPKAKTQRTQIIQKQESPKWNETFDFPVKVPAKEKVTIEVLNKKSGNKLGMAEILLKDLTIGDNFFSPNLKKGKLNINLVPQQFGNLPPKDVIQTKLKVVMDNLGMNEDQRKGIMSLPEKSQWDLVISNSKVDSQAKKIN